MCVAVSNHEPVNATIINKKAIRISIAYRPLETCLGGGGGGP